MTILYESDAKLVAQETNPASLIMGALFFGLGAYLFPRGHVYTAVCVAVGLAFVLLRHTVTLTATRQEAQVTIENKTLFSKRLDMLGFADIQRVALQEKYLFPWSFPSIYAKYVLSIEEKSGNSIVLTSASKRMPVVDLAAYAYVPNKAAGEKIAKYLNVPFSLDAKSSLAGTIGDGTSSF